jgi:hypothetical protein
LKSDVVERSSIHPHMQNVRAIAGWLLLTGMTSQAEALRLI